MKNTNKCFNKVGKLKFKISFRNELGARLKNMESTQKIKTVSLKKFF